MFDAWHLAKLVLVHARCTPARALAKRRFVGVKIVREGNRKLEKGPETRGVSCHVSANSQSRQGESGWKEYSTLAM